MIHDWCGHLDDPEGQRCPCHANTTSEFEVLARTRRAIRAAKASGWAGDALRRPANERIAS